MLATVEFVYSLRKDNYSPDSVCLAFAVAALGENLNLIFQIKNSGMSGIRPSAYPSCFFFSFICTITALNSVEFGRQMTLVISCVIDIEKNPGGQAVGQVNTVVTRPLTGQSCHGSVLVSVTWPGESFAGDFPVLGER